MSLNLQNRKYEKKINFDKKLFTKYALLFFY